MHYPEGTPGGAVVRRFFSLVAICFFLACPSFAQTAADSSADAPASKHDVERYLQAMNSHKMMQQMMEAMSNSMHQMVHDQCAKDKDKLPADCEARANKLTDAMMKEMPLDEMMEAMVPAYQKHFTKGDMDALIAFYSAPTGQKVLRELPAIMAEAMEAMRPIMNKAVDHMTERMQQEVAQMKKDSENGSGQKAPPANN
jgi:hypothetical protein